jgi:N-acetylmuramoyl-L-alanine amidase
MAVIVLDPGHGGTSKVGGSSPNNATGPTGLKEKEVTLKVAFAAEKALAASDHQVVLTRRGDNNRGIVERAAVAMQKRADVFVSIHCNAPGGSVPAQGTETWIGIDHTEASKALATVVQRRVRDATGHRNRGVKIGNVSGVIKGANHDRSTANCLVEISFLSLQPAEEERLRTQAYIDTLGQAIADAILEHLTAHELMPAGEEMDIEAAPQWATAYEANGGQYAELGTLDEEEDFGVPFNMLDAFERLSEMAPHGSDTAVERDGNLRTLSAPTIGFGPHARAEDVTAFSRDIVIDLMRKACLAHLVISSTSRSPADQARVMFNNLERFGVDHQKALYGAAGEQVIEVYRRAKQGGRAVADIKRAMTDEIVRIGPTRVSRHASDPNVLNVFDVAPSSVARRAAFEQAVRADRRVAKFIVPPSDPGYHLEIPQPGY